MAVRGHGVTVTLGITNSVKQHRVAVFVLQCLCDSVVES